MQHPQFTPYGVVIPKGNMFSQITALMRDVVLTGLDVPPAYRVPYPANQYL